MPGRRLNPDRDGLNNFAEYLAGTDPRDPDTDRNGFCDYDSRRGAGYRTWGELYDDGDGIADAWEADYQKRKAAWTGPGKFVG